mmetsp:Transcript_11320/g.19355  ORF Transcript_11320/g.19355 Transcript_11320/m.19355 type:complete len:99 (-) Transcript_11320:259-555(-)
MHRQPAHSVCRDLYSPCLVLDPSRKFDVKALGDEFLELVGHRLAPNGNDVQSTPRVQVVGNDGAGGDGIDDHHGNWCECIRQRKHRKRNQLKGLARWQ